MKKQITGQGWFVHTISSLAAGIAPEERFNEWGLHKLRDFFGSLSETRTACVSRRGWTTMEHPVLGTLQWKSGISPFFNYYLFLRVNGVPILSWKEGQRVPNWATTPEWIAPAATRLTEYDRHQVERWLSAN